MEKDLNLKATELRLGLPGIEDGNDSVSIAKNCKRGSPESAVDGESNTASASKAQIVGWPPVRFHVRKTHLVAKNSDTETGIYVKVSMDGAPYLRKIDLKLYTGYPELIKALENMFKLNIGEYSEREGYKGSKYSPAYEDKDGDLMLVGDVPWDMFISSCKRLRITKKSEAGGFEVSPLQKVLFLRVEENTRAPFA